MKSKSIYVCDCGETVYQAQSLEDLPCIPFEWYKDKKLFNKWDIYYCSKCNLIFRKRKLLKNYYNKIKEYFKS